LTKVYSWLLCLGYKTAHHYLFQVSLQGWLWLLVVLPPLLAVLRRVAWTSAIPLAAVGLLLLAGGTWARRRGYVVFEPAPPGEENGDSRGPERGGMKEKADAAPVDVDEQIPCRASGFFAVQDRRRYLLFEQASYSYVRTREHVVAAEIERTRFLLVARSTRGEAGWWYVFFMPEGVREVKVGHQFCGFRQRPALCIRYAGQEKEANSLEEIYLAFDDADAARRVIADLRLDVPPGVLAGAGNIVAGHGDASPAR
jgi:hypothetical protein